MDDQLPLPLQQCLSLQTGSCPCTGGGTSRLDSQPALLSSGEIDQESGLGLGRWSIFQANVGGGHSRADSHAALGVQVLIENRLWKELLWGALALHSKGLDRPVS